VLEVVCPERAIGIYDAIAAVGLNDLKTLWPTLNIFAELEKTRAVSVLTEDRHSWANISLVSGRPAAIARPHVSKSELGAAKSW